VLQWLEVEDRVEDCEVNVGLGRGACCCGLAVVGGFVFLCNSSQILFYFLFAVSGWRLQQS